MLAVRVALSLLAFAALLVIGAVLMMKAGHGGPPEPPSGIA
jgi:hypothetical protein